MKVKPAEMEQLLSSLSEISSQEDKIVRVLQQFFSFYPFTRLSLFTYSPMNHMSELLFFLDSDGSFLPSRKIKEDIRNVPMVYTAIQNKKASYVVVNKTKGSIPVKYIEEYELSSLLVVPIQKGSMVIGCVLADGYSGDAPFENEVILSIEEFFRLAFKVITAEEKQSSQVKLSNREIEVLENLSRGWSTKEMAAKMKISEFTARDYISSAMKKMNVNHRAQAIAEAVRNGWIS